MFNDNLQSNIGVPYQISSANVDGTGFMLNDSAKYTANTGIVTVSTSNSNLDGSGTLGTVLTAASNGTYIRTITVKCQQSTTLIGMVRLFVDDGVTVRLIKEITIPPIAQGSLVPAFVKVVPIQFSLKASQILKASTQRNASFNVIAEGLDWTY